MGVSFFCMGLFPTEARARTSRRHRRGPSPSTSRGTSGQASPAQRHGTAPGRRKVPQEGGYSPSTKMVGTRRGPIPPPMLPFLRGSDFESGFCTADFPFHNGSKANLVGGSGNRYFEPRLIDPWAGIFGHPTVNYWGWCLFGRRYERCLFGAQLGTWPGARWVN